MVLADGRTVEASYSENSDLYRALRGGGNNFGVVTRFELFTKPQGFMYGGLTVYSEGPGVDDDITNAFTSAIENAPSDPGAHTFISLSFVGSYVWSAGLYNANPDPPFSIFNGFYTAAMNSSKVLSTAATTPLTVQAEQLAQTQPSGMRIHFHTAKFRLNNALQQECFQIFREEVTRVNKAGLVNSTSFTPTLAFQALSTPFLSHQSQRGGNRG